MGFLERVHSRTLAFLETVIPATLTGLRSPYVVAALIALAVIMTGVGATLQAGGVTFSANGGGGVEHAHEHEAEPLDEGVDLYDTGTSEP